MEVIIDQQGEKIILKASGSLDESKIVEWRKILDNILLRQSARVVIDLSAVNFISSRAIGALLLFYKKLREQGKDMVIQAREWLYDLLVKIKLYELFPLEKK